METDWSSVEPGLRTNKTDSHAVQPASTHHQPAQPEPHYLKGLTIIRILSNLLRRFIIEFFRISVNVKKLITLLHSYLKDLR